MNFDKNEVEEEVKMEKLPDIPDCILNPTIFYALNYVYSFGGYEIHKNGSKKISKKVFRYKIASKKWFGI